MRTAFLETLFKLALADDRVMLLVGDLGFGVVTEFAEKLPNQFVNVGVAEQNMTSLAAGLALSGRVVYTYSIANFPVLRCLEQIRNDVCHHRANVKIVAVGGGLAYGALGFTHHATEDLAVMRALPDLVVVAPGDPMEANAATLAIHEHQGPCYLRLGRAGENAVHASPPSFCLGKALTVRAGDDLTLISTGGGLSEVAAAAERLAQANLSARVLSMHTLKPLDVAAVLQAAVETRAIFTVEEHSVTGGLGSAVAEVLLEALVPHPVIFRRLGLREPYGHLAGEQTFLRRQQGLGAEEIAQRVITSLQQPR
jgi:transketolase